MIKISNIAIGIIEPKKKECDKLDKIKEDAVKLLNDTLEKDPNIVPVDPEKIKDAPVNKNGNPIITTIEKVNTVIDPVKKTIKQPIEDPIGIDIYNDPVIGIPNLTDLNNIPMVCMKKELLQPLSA